MGAALAPDASGGAAAAERGGELKDIALIDGAGVLGGSALIGVDATSVIAVEAEGAVGGG